MFMKLYLFDEIDSTNTFLLNGDYEDGTVCASFNQISGKARGGRLWEAVPGDALALSVQLSGVTADRLMGIQIAAGYAMVEALMPYADVRMKWPNDLVYNGRKLAGMLIETRFSGNKLTKVVFGVGFNIRSTPPHLGRKAISLKEIINSDIDSAHFIKDSVRILEDKIAEYMAGDLDIVAEWPHYSANYMKTVSVHVNNERIHVKEAGITPDGRLKVDDGSGEIIVITEGEIGYDFGSGYR